jgi:hypothetical protein
VYTSLTPVKVVGFEKSLLVDPITSPIVKLAESLTIVILVFLETAFPVFEIVIS